MRKVVFGLFMVLYALSIVGGLVNRDVVRVIVAGVMAVELWHAFKLINQVLLTEGDTSLLTRPEKRTVLVTEFFSPVVAGAFYYYSWKSKFPNKAWQANKYSFLMLGLQLVVLVPLALLLAAIQS